MEVHEMMKLKESLCKELSDIAQKGAISAGDLDAITKLTDSIKDLGEIMEMEEGGEYSLRGGDGMWTAEGSYGRGNSYAGRRGTHYVRGHYSRESNGGGRGGGNYSRRGSGMMYSRTGGMEAVANQIRSMMEQGELPPAARDALGVALDELEM